VKKVISLVLSIVFVVVLMAGLSGTAVFADTVYTFGTVDGKGSPPVFSKQGNGGFYAYYSKEYNKSAKVSEASLILCEYGKQNNSYGLSTLQPKQEDILNYVNNIWPTRYPESADKPQFWWQINAKGTMCPAGDMTAVVGFKAPADGTYVVNAQCDGGAKVDGKDSSMSDGVSFNISFKGESLWSHNTGKNFIAVSSPQKAPEKTIQMKKDEVIYFMTDPNGHYAYDAAHWFINVTQKDASAPPPVDTTTAPQGSATSATKGTTGNQGATSATTVDGMTTGSEAGDSSTTADDAEYTIGDAGATDTQVETTTSLSDPEQEEKEKGSMLPIIIGIIVVVLGGGAAAAYFVLKKKKA